MVSFFGRSEHRVREHSRARRAGLGAALCVAGLLIVLSIPAVAGSLMARLQIYPALTNAEIAGLSAGAPTAIVILCAGRRIYAPEYGGETVDDVSLERLRYGAALARKTGLPILVSGGLATRTDPPLAALMAGTLRTDYGMTPKWLEDRSANTAENAVYSSQLLKGQNIRRVVLVTHAWHMARARAAFVANGMDVVAAPTAFYRPRLGSVWSAAVPSAHALVQSGYALHEIIGRLWYALRYGY